MSYIGRFWYRSSVGAVEAAYRKKYGIGISLSEQQLLDCSTNNKGCDGGAAANAFQYNVERKLNYRSFYPYGGTQGKCRYEPLVVGKLIKSYGVGVSVSVFYVFWFSPAYKIYFQVTC